MPPESPYGSLDALLRAEVGVGVEESRATVAERAKALANDPAVTPTLDGEALEQARKDGGEYGGRPSKSDGCGEEENLGHIVSKVSKPHGNNAEHLIRRLKRAAESSPKAADALRRLQSGELKSARAAAIEAGIITPPTLVEQCFALLRRMTAEEQAEVLAALGNDAVPPAKRNRKRQEVTA